MSELGHKGRHVYQALEDKHAEDAEEVGARSGMLVLNYGLRIHYD